MLAGYLPFDDDPANPEGDNINLLYKYIVTTPLTFPEYVTPHARDLLRRILVADPRKRADLFEVARHSWLSEYSHVVSFITSSTTTTGEISNATVTAGMCSLGADVMGKTDMLCTDNQQDGPLLARSASVREPSKSHSQHAAGTGAVGQKHDNVDHDQSPQTRPPRDAKRRTVQVEYVAPQSQTARELPISPAAAAASSPQPRPRTGTEASAARSKQASQVPQPYPGSASQGRIEQRPSSSTQDMGPPTRPNRDIPRSVSESTGAFITGNSIARPNTGGSLTSTGSSMRLPSRGSYSRPGQPVAPRVEATNAQGRLAQPSGKQYVISNPILQEDSFMQPSSYGRANVGQASNVNTTGTMQPPRGHKRSNTVGGIGEKIFGRSGSIFGGRTPSQTNPQQSSQKPEKSYPPTSMSGPIANTSSRPSVDSRRSTSFGFGRKNSSLQEKPRRFSFLPASFSLKNLGGGTRESQPPSTSHSMTENADFAQIQRTRPKRPAMAFGRGLSQSTSGGTTEEDLMTFGGLYNNRKATTTQQARGPAPRSNPQQRPIRDSGYPSSADQPVSRGTAGKNEYLSAAGAQGESALTTESESSLLHTPQAPVMSPYSSAAAQQGAGAGHYKTSTSTNNTPYNQPTVYTDGATSIGAQEQAPRWERGTVGLQRPARKFVDAYEQEPEGGRYGGGHGGVGGGGAAHHHPGAGHASGGGSSGAARKVMDFFRRRGKARYGDDR